MNPINLIKTIAQGGTTPSTTGKVEELTQGKTTDLAASVTTIINAVIGILGIVAVVIIIIGGINYMTSSGDAAKVKKAKDTILYGIIGLIVCVLAFAIANFVIRAINGTVGN